MKDLTMMSFYEKFISECTGRTDIIEIEKIEEIMRDHIFHSTLDWQTEIELRTAALAAVDILIDLKEINKQSAKIKHNQN